MKILLKAIIVLNHKANMVLFESSKRRGEVRTKGEKENGPRVKLPKKSHAQGRKWRWAG